jgi:hypothetical protein
MGRMKAILFGGAVGIGLFLVWQYTHTLDKNNATTQAIQKATAVAAKTDTVYVSRLATRAKVVYRWHTVRDTLRTVSPLTALADTVIQTDSTTLAACDSVVRAQKSLIVSLSRPRSQPFVRPFVDGWYSPHTHDLTLRAGLMSRPVWRNWQVSFALSDGTNRPQFEVGFHKTF